MNAKSIGISGLLVALFIFMVFMTSDPWYDISSSNFLLPDNIENLLRRVSMYGLLGIGVAFVIITSGIDLSIGSIVCLSACLLGLFLQVDYKALDSHDVFSVNANAGTVTVLGDATKTFQPGDQSRLFGGRAPALVTVKSTELVQLAGDDGEVLGLGSEIKVTGLERNDDTGQLARVYSVKNIQTSSTDAQQLTIDSNLLAPRDQVTFFHPDGGLMQRTIVKAEADANSSTITLNQAVVDGFSEQWMAIPLKRLPRMSIPVAIGIVLLIAAFLGWLHGILITYVRLQPFVVTLCGLLIYRGVSRKLANDAPIGFGNEYNDSLSVLGSGKLTLFEWATETGTESFGIPYPFFVLLVAAIVAAIFLNRTVWGRYLLALGKNEEAARYSGINTKRITIAAYVICTVAAATGGMLFAMDAPSISPSAFGNFFELYAIAAAVLGGCSLRGGEGSIVGVIAGTAVMMLLNNLILLLKIADTLEYTVIGVVILLGVMADEFVRRVAAKRRAVQAAAVNGSTETASGDANPSDNQAGQTPPV